MTTDPPDLAPPNAATPIVEGVAPDGRPFVHPHDRAAWRAWLIQHHATQRGVHLASWRKPSGREPLDYGEAVEEALCVGWVDSKGGKLDDDRGLLWFAPRNPRSGWARSNKDRVERLIADGLMLPAGQAAIDEAKRRGTWTMLDAVEDLIVPDDLAAALAAHPPAADHFAAFSKSTRRALLEWITQAKRPETREKRILETATKAARNERANEWVPKDQR